MGKSEITIKINMEPSTESLKLSVMMLELWLNAQSGRDILINRYTDHDGDEHAFITFVEDKDR